MTTPSPSKQERHIRQILTSMDHLDQTITVKPSDQPIVTDYRRQTWYSYTVNVKARG